MSCEAHIVSFNEGHIIGYAIRHYQTFCDKIVLHDAYSTDGTRSIARLYGVEVRDWDTKGQVNDEMLMTLKNTCWFGSTSDWVIVADADEFLWFPEGAKESLAKYTERGAAMIKTYGWEMTTDTFPTTEGQIYDEVKMGAAEEHYAAKPILFTPKIVRESGFGIGAHEAKPVLKNGMQIYVSRKWPKSDPPAYMLHYHHIGPLQMIADRYQGHIDRASAKNREMKWGSFRDPMVEATEQRTRILDRIMQVIP